MKKFKTTLLALGLTAVLAGCGNKLTTTKPVYNNSGMVAVIKGDASGKTVSYKAPTKTGSVKVHNGKYVVTLPMSTKAQTVTLKANGQTATTKIKAATAIGTYSVVAQQYNQALVMTAVPADTLKAMQAAQKQGTPTQAQIAAMTPAQQQALLKQQQEFQAALTKAKADVKDQQLPAKVEGLKQVVKTTSSTMRVNVQDGELLSATLSAPVKALKGSQKDNQFGIEFGLLANALGADAQKVGTQFQKAIKDQNGSQTTIKTITSNGVKFDVGFSASELFIYMTK